LKRITAWQAVAAAAVLAAYAVASLFPFQPLRFGIPHPVDNAAQWLPDGGLRFPAPGAARSAGAPEWLPAVISAERFDLSLRLRSLAPRQDGPARIFTVSSGPYLRDLTVGQEGGDLILRLRTPATDLNGIMPDGAPVASLPGALATPDWRDLDLAITPGRLRIDLDGTPRVDLALPQDALSTWDPDFHLALGNELTNDRPWLGEIARAVVATPEGAIDYAQRGALFLPPRFWVSIGPSTLVPFGEGDLSDVLLNLLGYLPLGLLLGLSARRSGSARLIAVVFLVSASFEMLQFFVPRHPSSTDLLLNTLGGGFGVVLGQRLRPLLAALWPR
jgi:hypothetical protein